MWVPARRGVGHLCQLVVAAAAPLEKTQIPPIRGAKVFDVLNTQLESGALQFKVDTCKSLVPEFVAQ